MNGTYDLNLVLASWCMAMAAAYAAFDLGGRLAGFDGLRQKLWLFAGALAMGSAIWSAHFIGIQALGLPQLRFDLVLTLLSWLAAVSVSLLALSIISRGRAGIDSLAGGGAVMGLGLCVMHYTGMMALRMTPHIDYAPAWFGASVLIAVALSAAALLIGLSVQRLPDWQLVPAKVWGALLMGAAISGMHHAGMAAARIADGAVCAPGNVLAAHWLSLPLGLFSLAIIAVVMLLSMFDAQRLEQRWQERQQTMTARFRRSPARG